MCAVCRERKRWEREEMRGLMNCLGKFFNNIDERNLFIDVFINIISASGITQLPLEYILMIFDMGSSQRKRNKAEET